MPDPDDTDTAGDESTRYGFEWGAVDELVWLRRDDGSYKRVHRDLIDLLEAVGRGECALADLPPDARDAAQMLVDQRYLVPGAAIVERPTPAPIRLWPRVGFFVVSLAALAAIVVWRWEVAWPPPADPLANLWAIPFFALAALLHEGGHYLASRPYFRPKIRFGLLNRVFPALITKTNDAWRCPKSVRIWISLAGPLVDIWLTLALAGVHLALWPGVEILSTLILVQFLRILFVFNPLLEGDGYWLLVDATDQVNLRTRGFADLKRLRPTGAAAFAAGSLVFTLFALAMSGWVVARMFWL